MNELINDNNINQLICRNIKDKLKAKGIKQENLAHLLKVTQSHLSERLNGKSPMKVAFMLKIAMHTNIPLLELIGAKELEKSLGLSFHNLESTQGKEIKFSRLHRAAD